MPVINCEVNPKLTWCKDCVIINSTGEGKFQITETKLYVPAVTLSTQDNTKLRLSPNMIGDFNDEANFPHKLLLTDRQVSRIRKAFANN